MCEWIRISGSLVLIHDIPSIGMISLRGCYPFYCSMNVLLNACNLAQCGLDQLSLLSLLSCHVSVDCDICRTNTCSLRFLPLQSSLVVLNAKLLGTHFHLGVEEMLGYVTRTMAGIVREGIFGQLEAGCEVVSDLVGIESIVSFRRPGLASTLASKALVTYS